MKSSELANYIQENREKVKSPPAENPKLKWLWLFLILAILGGGCASWLWLKQNNASVATENQSASAFPVRL